MVDEWLNSFSESDRRLILEAYLRTKEQTGAAVPAEFSALSPKDKFTLISVTLDGMLAVVIGKTSERKAAK